ncbi:hypothetical protein ILUMI_14027 [Ignelater luminosus]|uniref:Peptidase aspartic putative domain-containing protein n=1 Tax=Ignelater luminosus TaxID=2038154 RepID=A0A8K0CV12_IGNLU|nr:hypothetical protein ILUMI_14027 [Ignelater luminosus]
MVNTIEMHLECLKTWAVETKNWNVLLIPILLKKLDIQTYKEWETRLNKENNRTQIPTIEEFFESLNDKINTLDSVYPNKKGTDQNKLAASNKQISRAFATLKIECSLCKGEHEIRNCSDFSKLSPEERNQKARDLKLCINCMRNGHFLQNCLSKYKCKICSKKHHSLLHITTDKENKNSHNENAQVSDYSTQVRLNCTAELVNNHVILSTAQIKAFGSNGQKQIRVLLDSASQSHFITERVCDQLGLEKRPTNINVTGMGNKNVMIKHRVQITIHFMSCNFETMLKALVIPEITEELPSCILDMREFQIPSNIKLADPTFYQPGPIDMIIGANLFWELLCIGQIKRNNQPLLQKTKLGWIVSDGCGVPNSEEQPKQFAFLALHELHENVERFWEAD